MTKATLLQAACAAALLAATPVFAQTDTKPADTGAGGAPNVPAAHATPPATPAAKPMSHMHHSAMEGHHAKSGASAQDAAVDRLNDESYQAAEKGESFSGAGAAAPAAGATAPGGKM
jgi:hypothetical protein